MIAGPPARFVRSLEKGAGTTNGRVARVAMRVEVMNMVVGCMILMEDDGVRMFADW